jgi:hypothetical protein
MKYFVVAVLITAGTLLYAQDTKRKHGGDSVLIVKSDSAFTNLKELILTDLPVVTIDDVDMGEGGSQNISSVLTAGKDPFLSAAAYNFGLIRFKVRGYDAENFTTYINGVSLENLDNGFTPFGLWGGLNDVMRNRDLSIGLRTNTFAFGELGTVTNIDARAGKQRKQTEIGYAFSNRNYTHRFSFTHSTGFSKKGWAFSVSGSRRWADEGYISGTYYDGWSYYIAADKRINQKHLLSVIAFGAPTENGKQGAATAEVQELANNHYYNPYWGYQSGKKRNANVARTNQPVFIITHDFRINNKSSLITAISYSFGDKGASSIDWYNVPDPRPDYYRNLPSYYEDNPAVYDQIKQQWINNEGLRQINWANLYNTNTSSKETFNGITGYRSRYILSEAVNNIKKLNFNTVYNTRLGKRTEFTAGASYQTQKSDFFKRVLDLLGGDYFADLNQFAERSYPNNPDAGQPDLNNRNHVTFVGDRYQYDYDITINKASAWSQAVFKFRKIDWFGAVELSNTQFWRTGNMKNGLFPNNSFGKGSINNFNNYAVKTGLTYKINGRNYLYVNGAILTKAPYYDNVYFSSRTRDDQQNNVTNEEIKSIEGGYVLNAPKLKLRFTGYYSEFNNQLNVMSFYHDTYQNLVNYAINNINKQHYGLELGFNAKILPNVTLDGAASVGRFYYNSNQNATITLDNDASVLSTDTVYSNGYCLGSAPQEAYSLGLTYRSLKYWFVSLIGNYFDRMYLDINPIRRTYKAVENTVDGSPERNAILAQQRFNSQYTLDLFAGYSWKLPRKWAIHKKATFLVFNAGISNLLNNKNIISGGYEQLRFDFATNDINKFPPKYYYAYGLNYFISTILRF